LRSSPNTIPRSGPQLSVYDGQRHLGFLRLRGKAGVEAFDRDDHYIGIYPTQKEAADAVSALEAP
jgi:hypothetical protein